MSHKGLPEELLPTTSPSRQAVLAVFLDPDAATVAFYDLRIVCAEGGLPSLFLQRVLKHFPGLLELWINLDCLTTLISSLRLQLTIDRFQQRCIFRRSLFSHAQFSFPLPCHLHRCPVRPLTGPHRIRYVLADRQRLFLVQSRRMCCRRTHHSGH